MLAMSAASPQGETMRSIIASLSLLAAAGVAAPVQAAYTTVTYNGVVKRVVDPTAAPGISVGDIVTFSATFDPTTAVDVGDTFSHVDGDSGEVVTIPGLKTISLFDDPLASETITIGSSYTFTKSTDPYLGHDFGLGTGNFPLVVYNGSQLLGIDSGGIAANGVEFDFDPLAYLLGFTPRVGLGYGSSDEDSLAFTVTTDLDDAIGSVDLIPAVPEPGTWALLVAGLGLVGIGGKRRASSK
jgi:PEP-CTERM motif